MLGEIDPELRGELLGHTVPAPEPPAGTRTMPDTPLSEALSDSPQQNDRFNWDPPPELGGTPTKEIALPPPPVMAEPPQPRDIPPPAQGPSMADPSAWEIATDTRFDQPGMQCPPIPLPPEALMPSATIPEASARTQLDPQGEGELAGMLSSFSRGDDSVPPPPMHANSRS